LAYSTFHVNIQIEGSQTIWEMDVCGTCFQPVPGWDPETEAEEELILERLRAVAMAFIADHPELSYIWQTHTGSDSESTGTPYSDISDTDSDIDL
jgi:hypothetical protein